MVLYLDTKNKKYALPERKRVLFLENRARAREREREREREVALRSRDRLRVLMCNHAATVIWLTRNFFYIIACFFF